jgi:cell division septation protein DedD
MHIKLLNDAMIGLVNHSKGLVECDDERAKYLIGLGQAIEVKDAEAVPVAVQVPVTVPAPEAPKPAKKPDAVPAPEAPKPAPTV